MTKYFRTHEDVRVRCVNYGCSCPLCPEQFDENYVSDDDGDWEGGWAEGAYNKDDEGDEGD